MKKLPWGVKVGPDLVGKKELIPLIQVCEDAGCHFYVACNTYPEDHPRFGKGGVSGPDLQHPVSATVAQISTIVPKEKVIIACGGVNSGKQARKYEECGANVVEAYAGFVTGKNSGPQFAHKVLKEWSSLR